MPKVSVIIPCYNDGDFLQETLDSLREQSFIDYEIIVVNDGSTDEVTIALLRSIAQSNTKVFHTKNMGVSAARNKGITEASGEYILPLDADDTIGADYLERAVNVLEARPEVAAVYFERVLFGEHQGTDQLPDYDPKALLIDNCMYAALFRKADWKSVGGFSESMVYGWEDWDFWISLSELGKLVVKIPEPLFFYRIRSSSRDHSLQLHHKIAMMLVMVFRHKCLYLRNLDLLVKRSFSLILKVISANSKSLDR